MPYLHARSSIFVYFRAGEVVENRSVLRHFRIGGGAILMVLVVFEALSYKGGAVLKVHGNSV